MQMPSVSLPVGFQHHTIMIELDEILYNALKADADLMQAVDGRIVSTCFEVGPDEQDNTELPCIIVTDNGFNNQPLTKDTTWEAWSDAVQAGIEVDGRSPREVKTLRRMARRAVAAYIEQLADSGEEVPILDGVQSNGVAWDWTKPCYHSTITYNCSITNDYGNT